MFVSPFFYSIRFAWQCAFIGFILWVAYWCFSTALESATSAESIHYHNSHGVSCQTTSDVIKPKLSCFGGFHGTRHWTKTDWKIKIITIWLKRALHENPLPECCLNDPWKQSRKGVSRADAIDVSIIIQFSLPENLRQSQIDDSSAHKRSASIMTTFEFTRG